MDVMTNQLPFGSERVPVLFPVGISCILLVPLRAAERRVLPQRAQDVPLPGTYPNLWPGA